MEAIPRTYPYLQEDWMIAILVIMVALLGIIRYNYPNRIVRLLQSIFRARMLRQLMREELVLSHRASLALMIIFSANTALLVYLAAKSFGWSAYLQLEQWFFVVVFLAVLLLYLWKIISIRLFQFFFETEGGLSEYLVFSLVFNMLLGLLWIPLILAAVVSLKGAVQVLFMAVLVIFLLGYLARLVRGALIAREHRVFSVYIILYLCALEILPFAVLAKGIAEMKF
jgi:hypothetical protein